MFLLVTYEWKIQNNTTIYIAVLRVMQFWNRNATDTADGPPCYQHLVDIV